MHGVRGGVGAFAQSAHMHLLKHYVCVCVCFDVRVKSASQYNVHWMNAKCVPGIASE